MHDSAVAIERPSSNSATRRATSSSCTAAHRRERFAGPTIGVAGRHGRADPRPQAADGEAAGGQEGCGEHIERAGIEISGGHQVHREVGIEEVGIGEAGIREAASGEIHSEAASGEQVDDGSDSRRTADHDVQGEETGRTHVGFRETGCREAEGQNIVGEEAGNDEGGATAEG